MSKLISQLPEDIKVVALQRQREQTNGKWDKNTDILEEAFSWEHTLEEEIIWSKVNKGNYEPFRQFHNLKQPENNGWISVKDELPTVEKHGEKVFLYRIMNDTQETMPISVHDTRMVKHCNPNETWWQPLFKAPKY